MSRYVITLSHGENSDEEAAIGFDPPLRTFFLQGFMEEEGEGLPLPIWLGTVLEEYTTLESIAEEARAQGYEIKGLPRQHVIEMLELAGQRHEPRIAEILGLVI